MIRGSRLDPRRRAGRQDRYAAERRADVRIRRVTGADGPGRAIVVAAPGGTPYSIPTDRSRKPGSQLPTGSHISVTREMALPTPPGGYSGSLDFERRDFFIDSVPYGPGCSPFQGWVRIENFNPLGGLLTFNGTDRVDWPSALAAGECQFDLIAFSTGCLPAGSVIVGIDTTGGVFPSGGDLGTLAGERLEVRGFQIKEDGKRVTIHIYSAETELNPTDHVANLHMWHPNQAIYAGFGVNAFHGVMTRNSPPPSGGTFFEI